MIEWATTATAAGLSHLQCLNPELAKKFNIEFLVQYGRRPALYSAGEPRIASEHVGVLRVQPGKHARKYQGPRGA